jgi:RNA polymerase sigma-70 factor (ECF subfamily)
MKEYVPTDKREEQQPVRAEDGYAQRERRFRQLYEEHYHPLQAYTVRRLDARDDVADVVAEVFTTAWRRLDDIPAPPETRLWLYGVARRVLAGHRRSSNRFRKLIARVGAAQTTDSAYSQLGPDIADHQVIRALRQVPPAEREALMLTVWEQLSHTEAAQVLGCSPNAVGIRVHRARVRLRAVLGEPPPESPASQKPSPVHMGGHRGH